MKNLEEQIKQWNDENEFEKCVEAIEAVPEAERGYELTLLLGRAYRNIAVLGPHCERPDGDDWHKTGPMFQYLQSMGFRVFASVFTFRLGFPLYFSNLIPSSEYAIHCDCTNMFPCLDVPV